MLFLYFFFIWTAACWKQLSSAPGKIKVSPFKLTLRRNISRRNICLVDPKTCCSDSERQIRYLSRERGQFSEIDHLERAEITSLGEDGNLCAARRRSIRDATYWSDIIASHYPAPSLSERQHKDVVGGEWLSSHVMWLSRLNDCGSCDTLNKKKHRSDL